MCKGTVSREPSYVARRVDRPKARRDARGRARATPNGHHPALRRSRRGRGASDELSSSSEVGPRRLRRGRGGALRQTKRPPRVPAARIIGGSERPRQGLFTIDAPRRPKARARLSSACHRCSAQPVNKSVLALFRRPSAFFRIRVRLRLVIGCVARMRASVAR